jgi:RNA polymerase sigma factor (sigma-70 family)
MTEPSFDQYYLASERVASVRAATTVALCRLPRDARDDFQQEALLELWSKHPRFDSRRASWRTFAERVVANKMTSLVRTVRSRRSGHLKEGPLEDCLRVAAPAERPGLRLDVHQVLTTMSEFDREVALNLSHSSALETSQSLRVSRATIYRSIARLRAAFIEAGISHVLSRQASAGLSGRLLCNPCRTGVYA